MAAETWKDPTFAECLDNPQLRAIFLQHLQKRFCAENLIFYDIVQEYKKMPDGEQKAEKAREIWKEYLAPGSENQVNLDAEMYDAIKAHLDAPTQNMFNVGQQYAYDLLRNDAYPGFMRSKFYTDWKAEMTTPRGLLPKISDPNAASERVVLVNDWSHSATSPRGSTPIKKMNKKIEKELRAIEEAKARGEVLKDSLPSTSPPKGSLTASGSSSISGSGGSSSSSSSSSMSSSGGSSNGIGSLVHTPPEEMLVPPSDFPFKRLKKKGVIVAVSIPDDLSKGVFWASLESTRSKGIFQFLLVIPGKEKTKKFFMTIDYFDLVKLSKKEADPIKDLGEVTINVNKALTFLDDLLNYYHVFDLI